MSLFGVLVVGLEVAQDVANVHQNSRALAPSSDVARNREAYSGISKLRWYPEDCIAQSRARARQTMRSGGTLRRPSEQIANDPFLELQL